MMHPDIQIDSLVQILCPRIPPDMGGGTPAHHAICRWTNEHDMVSYTVPCAIGRNGARHNKHEGDGTTPLGIFSIRRLWIRPDRVSPPATNFKIRLIREHCAWSDDPNDPDYNRYVCRPHPYHSETLYRTDHIYDIFFELGINDSPPQPGGGSALFLHLAPAETAQQKLTPTEGCIALRRADMMQLIAHLTPDTYIEISTAIRS